MVVVFKISLEWLLRCFGNVLINFGFLWDVCIVVLIKFFYMVNLSFFEIIKK